MFCAVGGVGILESFWGDSAVFAGFSARGDDLYARGKGSTRLFLARISAGLSGGGYGLALDGLDGWSGVSGGVNSCN